MICINNINIYIFMHTHTYNIKRFPNAPAHTGYSVPEIKRSPIVANHVRGTSHMVREMKSMFPTGLAAESNTLNIRTPKKHQQVQFSRDKRSPICVNHMGGKSQMERNYVYVS